MSKYFVLRDVDTNDDGLADGIEGRLAKAFSNKENAIEYAKERALSSNHRWLVVEEVAGFKAQKKVMRELI